MSDAHIEAKNIALQLLRPIEIVTPDDVDRAVTLTRRPRPRHVS